MGYFLGLTGYSLRGKEVIECGIADFYVKQENVQDLENEIVKSTNLNTSIEEIREITRKYSEPLERNQLKYKHEDLINNVFGKSSLEEIYNELQSSNQEKEFTKKILQMMKGNSPLSMKIIFEQIKRGENLNFEENLKMDMRLADR